MFVPLAQLTDNQTQSIFTGCFIIIGLVLVGAVVVLLVRRRLQGPDNAKAASFTLGDLRQLHASGQLTGEEFEKAKQVILAATQAHLDRNTAAGLSQSDIDLAKARSRAKGR